MYFHIFQDTKFDIMKKKVAYLLQYLLEEMQNKFSKFANWNVLLWNITLLKLKLRRWKVWCDRKNVACLLWSDRKRKQFLQICEYLM